MSLEDQMRWTALVVFLTLRLMGFAMRQASYGVRP
jgi:hypothetical protein